MTNTQLDIIIGSLLGDGYLSKYGRSKNAMFRFKQSSKYASYVDYMYRSLSGYVSCGVRTEKVKKPSKVDGKISHAIKYWNGEFIESHYFWTKSNLVFTKFYQSWYPEGKKVVPKDLKLNPRIIAHWYAQDGSNNVTKNSKGVFLYTNSFTLEECEFLAYKLKDLSIKTKIYKGAIRITAGSYFRFIEIIKPYMIEFGCFQKKIDTSKAPADRNGEKWVGAKLNMDIAYEIRRSSLSRQELSCKYGVTVGTICKIINNQMYKEKKPDFRIGGSASVGMKYD